MTRSVLPVLAAALAALSLAACGSSSSGDSGTSDDEKRLAFEDCLRDEGLRVASSPDGRGTSISADAGSGAGDPRRAMETCRRKTGWAPREPSAEDKAEMRDRALRLARCMRAHGVDMPDPSSDGAVMLRGDPGSATFRRAQEACGMGAGGAAPAFRAK